MSSEFQEWLSAASDNQPVSAAELDALLADPQLQQQWLNYQLVGSVIRNEALPDLSSDFADNFAALLEQEPAHQLAAESVPVLTTAAAAKVNVTPAANQSWWKWVMQGAMAASVAVVAVLGVQQSAPDDKLTAPLPVLQTSPIGGVAAPVSLSQTSVQSAYTPQQTQAQLEQQRRLQELLQLRQQQIRLMEQAAAQQAGQQPPEAEKQQ